MSATILQFSLGFADAFACGDCGVPVVMPVAFLDDRLRDHRTWYCLNGHPRHYPGKSEVEKLRDELERVQRSREWAEQRAESNAKRAAHLERRANGMKGALVKTQKRIAKGVCPCCNRAFVNVERHMTTQHPDYGTVTE